MKRADHRQYTVTVDHALTGADALRLCEEAQSLPFDAIGQLNLSMARVERIDASGVAAVVRLFSHLARGGKRMALVDVHDDVLSVLEAAGLTSVMVIQTRPARTFELAADASGLHDGSQLF